MKNTKKLLIALFSCLALTLMVHAGQEPEQNSDTTSTPTFTTCPSGSCSYTTTPGSWYCGSCWFYDCGCTCTTASFTKTTYTGICSQWTISFGEPPLVYTKYFNDCVSASPSGTTTFNQQLCYQPGA